MDVTLEQARVLDTVIRRGTIQKAAEELNRSHTSVIYSLQCLEAQTQLKVFIRSGRRNQLTREGEVVLKFCRRLLETQSEFESSCRQLRTGWEPSLALVYDEVVDFNFIGEALFQLNRMKPPTEVKIISAHLAEVEELFNQNSADFMVTILPPQGLRLRSRKLKPISMVLVAHRDHPLARSKSDRLGFDDLNKHTYVTISTTQGQLGLGTELMSFDSYFIVTSFMSKKLALLNRLGFGWLPDYLIQNELRKGILRKLKTDAENVSTLSPRLYFKNEDTLGAAAKELLKNMLLRVEK